MNHIVQRVIKLSTEYNSVKIFDSNALVISKGIGRIPGKFDQHLFDFLKNTNGASILDYCFLGFKNNKLGYNIDNYMLDIWSANNVLAGKFIPFMTTSLGDNYGYLKNDNNESIHQIAYYSDDNSDIIYTIAPSFNEFMEVFLDGVEKELATDPSAIYVDQYSWPMNIEYFNNFFK